MKFYWKCHICCLTKFQMPSEKGILKCSELMWVRLSDWPANCKGGHSLLSFPALSLTITFVIKVEVSSFQGQAMSTCSPNKYYYVFVRKARVSMVSGFSCVFNAKRFPCSDTNTHVTFCWGQILTIFQEKRFLCGKRNPWGKPSSFKKKLNFVRERKITNGEALMEGVCRIS